MLRDQAAAAGMDVYLAEHDVQPGQSLAEKIRLAILQSDAVVVLLTKAGAASAYVQQEIGVAVAAGKPLVPIVQDGPENLAMLDGVEYVSFDPEHPAVAIRDLTKFMTDLAERKRADQALALESQHRTEMLVLLGILLFVLIAMSSE